MGKIADGDSFTCKERRLGRSKRGRVIPDNIVMTRFLCVLLGLGALSMRGERAGRG